MKNTLSLLLALFMFSCGNSPAPDFSSSTSEPISHELFDELLAKYVSVEGNVNYKAMLEDKEVLDDYLSQISNNAPSDKWSKNEKLVYWINAYNSFTIKLILDNYPIESIGDLHSSVVSKVWDKKFFAIGGKDMNLNTIEHEILRKEFQEPRIHFAIVCASKSCPKLLNEAYTAEKIERQLTSQVKAFLVDDFRNKLSEEKIELSKIFSWFEADFTKEGSLIGFLNLYAPVKIKEDAKVIYLAYDWGLNE